VELKYPIEGNSIVIVGQFTDIPGVRGRPENLDPKDYFS